MRRLFSIARFVSKYKVIKYSSTTGALMVAFCGRAAFLDGNGGGLSVRGDYCVLEDEPDNYFGI